MEAVYFNATLKGGWVDVVTEISNPYAKVDALEGRHA